MTHKKVFLLILILFLILLLPILLLKKDYHKPADKKIFLAPMGEGTPDNPKARLEYEWMKLHDPATGKIPANIRTKELAFVRKLPRKYESNSGFNKTTIFQPYWRARGPYNIGGRTRAFAIDVTDEKILFAGGVSGGVWKSVNGGASWVKTTNPYQLHSVTSIAQDKRSGKTQTWYYGTGELSGNSAGGGYYVNDAHFSGDGIYKSTNAGASWERIASTYSGTPTDYFQNGEFDYVWRIITDPANAVEDEVYAAVYNGIYRSTDGGNSWKPVLGLDTNFSNYSEYTDITISTTGVLYATLSSDGNSKGIWRSENGVNWTNIKPTGWPVTFNRTAIGIAPSNENIVYFLSETPGSGKHDHNLWKYTYIKGDGADTNGIWENRSANLPTYDCTGFYTFEFGNYSSQSSYDMYVKVKPNDTNIVFLGGTNVYRSTDGFASGSNYSWIGGYFCDSINYSNYVYPNHHPDQHDLLFLTSDPNTMISASDGGLSITYNNMADSVAWKYLNNGYMTSQFYTIAIEPGNTSSNIMVGGMQDNGTWFTNSIYKDSLWKNTFYGDGAYCAISTARKYYYISWQSGKTFKFTIEDNGTVTGLTRIDPSGGTGYMFINPFILDPNNTNIMYLIAGSYLWRNDGLDEIPILNDEYNTSDSNWVKLTQSAVGGISALAMSKGYPDRVYYGTRNGKLFALDSASFTNPPAKKTITGSMFPAVFISCVAPDPDDGNKVIVVFSNYGVKSLFYTKDAGTTWESISGNFEENPDGTGNGPSVKWVSILHFGDSTIYYAAASVGLFSTTLLKGDSTIWVQEGTSTIGNVVVDMLVTRAYDTLVVAATHGAGVYSYKFNEPDTIKVPVDSTVFSVVQNYPNPFNSFTNIDYLVEQESYVECKVFDLSGKLVAVLLEGTKQAGKYSILWNGKGHNGNDLKNGIYIYRLKVGDKVTTHKMVLII